MTRSYWRTHQRTLLVAWLCGFAFVALAVTRLPVASRGFVAGLFLIFALVCAPFTLRTAAGRAWWASSAVALGCGSGAVFLGASHPLTWPLALAAGGAYAVGVCLRWHPR